MSAKHTKLIWMVFFTSLWGAAVACGMWRVLNYEKTPGITLQAPSQWPTRAPVALASHGETLVLFVHPQCPCTKATIGELAVLMNHCQENLTTYLFFLNPDGFSEDWSKGWLWKETEKIPGVRLLQDKNGEVARYFRATTSGQSLLYGSNGKLLFEGGITSSRGHRGDSAGRRAIASLVLKGRSEVKQTSVFGCALFNPSGVKK